MGVIMHKGIAYGGGSDVTANPQDTATADLEKVKIDGTTYDVTDADAIHNADVGAAGGVAELDANGQVPSAQLPTPPTVNNNTITIQLNGTTVETFTLNQSSDETINIQVTKSDVGLGNVPNVTTDNQTPTVTEASSRANLTAGDTLKTIIGKIKKFFSDLGDLAFINKDGSSSTKFLQGDGTWQTFPSIPAAQVNSDWNATSGVAQILNKPTIPTNTDEKVKQENTTGSADYRVLLSNGANDTTETKTARKSTKLKFNPSTGNLQATQLNGVNIGSSPKFTDENTTYTLSVSGNSIVLTPSSGSANTITVPYATSAGSATDSTKIPLAGSTGITGSLVPTTNHGVDLGVYGKGYRTLYASDVTLGSGGVSTGQLKFQHSGANSYNTSLLPTKPTAYRTQYLPDENGTLATQEWANNTAFNCCKFITLRNTLTATISGGYFSCVFLYFINNLGAGVGIFSVHNGTGPQYWAEPLRGNTNFPFNVSFNTTTKVLTVTAKNGSSFNGLLLCSNGFTY